MVIKKLPSTGDRPQNSHTRTGLPNGITAGGLADSAGFAWAGRTFEHHDTAFADDDGKTPVLYSTAVSQVRKAAEVYYAANTSRDTAKIGVAIAALAEAQQSALRQLKEVRVLIPLVAAAGEVGYTDTGKLVEKTQELSIVTVAAPDGRRVMPVFSSVETMRSWDATARPIPIALPQALVAAAQEETSLVIIDPASPESELGIRSNQFNAAATGVEFVPCWADSEIAAQATAVLCADELVKLAVLLPADPEMRLLTPETELVLGVQQGLAAAQVQAVSARAGARWQQNEILARAADSLKMRLVAV